jgi:hypothetical protein
MISGAVFANDRGTLMNLAARADVRDPSSSPPRPPYQASGTTLGRTKRTQLTSPTVRPVRSGPLAAVFEGEGWGEGSFRSRGLAPAPHPGPLPADGARGNTRLPRSEDKSHESNGPGLPGAKRSQPPGSWFAGGHARRSQRRTNPMRFPQVHLGQNLTSSRPAPILAHHDGPGPVSGRAPRESRRIPGPPHHQSNPTAAPGASPSRDRSRLPAHPAPNEPNPRSLSLGQVSNSGVLAPVSDRAPLADHRDPGPVPRGAPVPFPDHSVPATRPTEATPRALQKSGGGSGPALR